MDASARRRFTEMVSRPDAAVDLAEASLLIASEEYPGLDSGRYLARLDDLGRSLRQRLTTRTAGEGIQALNALLFEQEGFRGNVQDYYDPRNSFLNEVLDRRTGIPITLSTVYIEVGRRGGLDVEGVGLPGHFIVRVSTAAGTALVDPFYDGTIITEADCQERLDRIYGGKVKVEPGMLNPCGRKGMLGRMLRNLKGIYSKAGDHARALRTVELLLLVDPGSLEELRDRGLLYASLDCYAAAGRDLEAYLEAVPGDPEADDLGEKIAEMRRKASRLN